VFYEGSYQGWLHRKCAGLTHPAFDKLGEPDTQYLCSYRMNVSQSMKVSKLADTIKNLNTAITFLTETIISLQSSVTKQSHPTTIQEELEIASNATPLKKTVDDRSMNIVVYGIDESHPTTPKSDRTRNDLSNVLPILSAVDSSIQDASINNLGRFDPST